MLDFVAPYTPYTLTVYASSFPLPVRSQDSLRGVWLGLTPAGLPPARFRQLLLAHQHTKPDPLHSLQAKPDPLLPYKKSPTPLRRRPGCVGIKERGEAG